MIDYTPLQNSWKNHFLGSHLQFLLHKIQLHENNLVRICRVPSNKIFKQFNKTSFWEELKTNGATHEINELYDIWQKIKHLPHLNARELIEVLQEQVIVLERYHHLALDALQKRKIQMQGEFTPWFSPSINPYISKLQENRVQLQAIKSMIYEGLLWRSHAYRLLNTTSNVDDIVAALCHKINAYRALSTPLPIKAPFSATLNGDRRVAIFDYLQETNSDKDALYDVILSPVLKKGYPRLKSAVDIRQELSLIKKFHKKIIQDLSNHLEKTHFARLSVMIPLDIRKTGNKLLKKIPFFPLIAHLRKFRYVLYLSLSFIFYFYLAMLLQPITVFFSAINPFLFYTVAMAPIWILSFNFLVSCKDNIYTFFVHKKKNQLYSALDTLINGQELIANHLSQVIIDIPNFDIQHTIHQIDHQQGALIDIKQKLNHYVAGERYFCKGIIDCTITLVLIKIQKQEKQIISQLTVLANHIALRVGQDIEILHKAINKQAFTVTIPEQQFEKLQKFVGAFGDEATLNLFKENANPIYKWTHKLERYLQHDSENDSLLRPWGGWRVRQDYFNGWHTILKGYLPIGNQQNAALQLNALLNGHCQPTTLQFTTWLDALNIGNQKPVLMQKIQTHLFKTLNANTAQNVHLICEPHKDLIAKWYDEHEVKIHQAQKKIISLLKALPDKTAFFEIGDHELSHMYALLEGGDIFCYLSHQDDSDIKQRKQLAKAYFDLYQGQSSNAIRFLTFFNENEQEALLVHIAKKRLSWLLSHLGDGVNPANPFDEMDMELFYDYRLIMNYEAFDFTTSILKSDFFNNPWNQPVETFLNVCRRRGLDSGQLLKQYQKTNYRIKPFVLHLHKTKSKHHQKLSQSSPEVAIAEKEKESCYVKF